MNVTHYAAAMIGLAMGWGFNHFGYGSFYAWSVLIAGAIPWYFVCENADLRKSNWEMRMTLRNASLDLSSLLERIEELDATVARLEKKAK